jgi:hypothetical protein
MLVKLIDKTENKKNNGMNRRKFIENSMYWTAILTVPQFIEFCASTENKQERVPQDTIKYLIPIKKTIVTALNAPNAHNVQPWKFKIINDFEAYLYVDENRLLPETDPTNRQIYISQGTFLETLKIAANSIQYKTEIKLFPEGLYKKSELGKKPVAKIKLTKDETINETYFVHYINKRATNRTEYYGNDITEEDFNFIKKQVDPEYSTLEFVKNSSSYELKKLLIKALEIETFTEPKHDESRIWFRYNDEEIFSKRDGISLRGNGVEGIKYFFARNFFLKPGKESWHSEGNLKVGIEMFQKLVMSSKGFIYLKTKTNTLEDWVNVGRDYARLHLSVTAQNKVMHPMSQVLQEYKEMDETRIKLEQLLNVKAPEKIQMIVRLGISDYRFFSPRRSLESYL